MPGTFVWNELVTADTEGCKRFYGALVGWQAHEVAVAMPEGTITYTLFKRDGREVAGMMKMEGPAWTGIPPHWMAYIEVEDVDAAVARVAALGGTVCVPPTDIPEVGRFSVIKDPAGATVSLMTSRVGTGM